MSSKRLVSGHFVKPLAVKTARTYQRFVTSSFDVTRCEYKGNVIYTDLHKQLNDLWLVSHIANPYEQRELSYYGMLPLDDATWGFSFVIAIG